MAREDERHHLFSFLEERFGIPEKLFDDYLLFSREKSWTLIRNGPHVISASQLKVSKVGLRAFKRIGRFVKPTTRMIQIFGSFATKATVKINQEQLSRLLEGEQFPVQLDLDQGYVILALDDGRILGLGLLIKENIRSQLPRKEIRQCMLGE
ncbi:MAG: hypothetical protein U9N82_01475 [Thermodesulfobacteriota bacterium]|nr:hypothetical protein [Thermodesulfobacteriota bacterium]